MIRISTWLPKLKASVFINKSGVGADVMDFRKHGLRFILCLLIGGFYMFLWHSLFYFFTPFFSLSPSLYIQKNIVLLIAIGSVKKG